MRSTDTGTDGHGWQPVICARIGAPALRFKGRLLDRQTDATSAGRLTISLYQRKSGGFAVALARLTESGDWADHAFKADTIGAASAAVEGYCTDLGEEVERRRPVFSGDVAAFCRDLSAHVATAASVVSYQLLAGQALDRWVGIAEVGAVSDAVA